LDLRLVRQGGTLDRMPRRHKVGKGQSGRDYFLTSCIRLKKGRIGGMASVNLTLIEKGTGCNIQGRRPALEQKDAGLFGEKGSKRGEIKRRTS